jgi:hypothetical protein
MSVLSSLETSSSPASPYLWGIPSISIRSYRVVYELIKLLDNPGNSVSVLNLRFKKCGDTLPV